MRKFLSYLIQILLMVAICLAAIYFTANATTISSGDTDGSGSITVADAMYLIYYIFAGGPAPVEIPCPDEGDEVLHLDTNWIEWYAGGRTFTRAEGIARRAFTIDSLTGQPTWYYIIPDTADWWGSAYGEPQSYAIYATMDAWDSVASYKMPPLDMKPVIQSIIDRPFERKVIGDLESSWLHKWWVSGVITYRQYLDYRLHPETNGAVMRFQTKDIPADATIDSAVIQWQSWTEYGKEGE